MSSNDLPGRRAGCDRRAGGGPAGGGEVDGPVGNGRADARPEGDGRTLADLTWPDLTRPESGAPTLLVPVGATEQHGPHLPLDTDTRIATAVARRAAAHVGGGAVVAPPIAFTASGEHEGFAGTISIGHEALHTVLVEVGRSACRWAPRLVFVNGHGGNFPTLPAAVRLLRSEGRDVAWFACAAPGGDAHAGRTETSALLALDPSAVRRDRAAAGATAPLSSLLAALRAGGVAAVSPNGVLGDPAGAAADEGATLLAAMTAALVEGLLRWAPRADGRL